MSATHRRAGIKCRRNILIVDDHPLTRHGMAQLIAQQADLLVCGEAGDAAQARSLVEALRPDLVLADVTLPDKHGLELIRDLQTLEPGIRVLVVSMHDESLYAERALRAGARGYLMKNEGGEKLLEAIRQVLAGQVYLSPTMAAKVLEALSGPRRRAGDATLGRLTDREFEVFQFVGQGLTTREIGHQLHLSPKTVETYRLAIRQKLGLKSGPELIRHALRWAAAQQLM